MKHKEINYTIYKMFVTSYYDIYNKPEKFFEYLYLFYDLAISGLPIILFTDPKLVYKFRIFGPNVKVIGLPIESFELYAIATQYKGELPSQRSVIKDTKEFFALMNTKIEFILKASNICEDQTLIWIDYGILKIVKDREQFIQKLHEINTMSFDKITMPGCWQFGHPFSVESVSWRFCGGFFIIPRKDIQRFFNHSKNVLNDFCNLSMYKLTWETNVWAVIELCAEKDNIQWYFADHNDSIVLSL